MDTTTKTEPKTLVSERAAREIEQTRRKAAIDRAWELGYQAGVQAGVMAAIRALLERRREVRE